MAWFELERLNTYLTNRSYLGSEQEVSLLDFARSEAITRMGGVDRTSLPHLARWHRHVSFLKSRSRLEIQSIPPGSAPEFEQDKRRTRLQELLGQTMYLDQRIQNGEGHLLHRFQHDKVALRAEREEELQELRRAMPRAGAPSGLRTSCVAAALAQGALDELRPLMFSAGKETKANDTISVEVGCRTGYYAEAGLVALSEVPQTHRAIAAATEALGLGQVDDARLNVICRQYMPGHALGMHRDGMSDGDDLFEEDVFGMILENTSDETLRFQSPLGGYHMLTEEEGACFMQSGDARYEWQHGVDYLTRGQRVSLTWRWFKKSARR